MNPGGLPQSSSPQDIDAAGRNRRTEPRGMQLEEAEVGLKSTKVVGSSWSLNLTRLPPPSREKLTLPRRSKRPGEAR